MRSSSSISSSGSSSSSRNSNRAIPYWNVPYDIQNFATFFSLVTTIKRNEFMFCFILRIMGRLYIAIVSWSYLLFFYEIHGKIAICRTRRREILHPTHHSSVYLNTK